MFYVVLSHQNSRLLLQPATGRQRYTFAASLFEVSQIIDPIESLSHFLYFIQVTSSKTHHVHSKALLVLCCLARLFASSVLLHHCSSALFSTLSPRTMRFFWIQQHFSSYNNGAILQLFLTFKYSVSRSVFIPWFSKQQQIFLLISCTVNNLLGMMIIAIMPCR